MIHAVRNLRSQVNLPGKEAPVIVRAGRIAAAGEERHQIARLCFAAPLTIDSIASAPPGAGGRCGRG